MHLKKINALIIFFLIILTIFPFVIYNNTSKASSLVVETSADWAIYEDSSDGVKIETNNLLLDNAVGGNWTSRWFSVSDVSNPQLIINTTIDLFSRIKRTIILDGSAQPYGSGWYWYGRPCLHIDVNNHSRWILGTRIGNSHSDSSDGFTFLFSSDSGKTWGDFSEYYNGTTIKGAVPAFPSVYCGEPHIIGMPNGDLVCHIWNGLSSGDFLQYRSIDDGYTWTSEGEKTVSGISSSYALKASQDYVINPYNEYEVLLSIQRRNKPFYSYLAKTTDNGSTYSLVSSIDTTDTFEPSLEFVGNNTLISVLRPGDSFSGGYGQTLMRKSTDMGATWGSQIKIGNWLPYPPPHPVGEVRVWERARTYIESNTIFDPSTYMNYTLGEGRLWGVGTQDYGGSQNTGSPQTNRTIAVYWSDSQGDDDSWSYHVLWSYPPSHADPPPSSSHRCAGYGDIRRRSDGSFCVVSYYDESGGGPADLVQIDFGGERARVMVEADTNIDGVADENTSWHEIYNGTNTIDLSGLSNSNWRIKYYISNNDTASTPIIDNFYGTGFLCELASFGFRSINEVTNDSITSEPIYLFNWMKDNDTVYYQLQIANDSGFTDVFVNLTNINIVNYPSNYTEIGGYVEFVLPASYRRSWYQDYYMRVRPWYYYDE